MATKKLFDLSNDKQILDEFTKLKPKAQIYFTIDELIIKYYKQIETSIKMGYTFEELCSEIFNANGCNINPKILQSRYNKLNQDKLKNKKKSGINSPRKINEANSLKNSNNANFINHGDTQ